MLEIFERKLKNRKYFEDIMCQLSFKAQNDVTTSTRRLLSAVISKNLARLISYKGTSEKTGIRDFTFFQLIIIDVITRKQIQLGSTEEGTIDSIVKATKNWCHDQRLKKKLDLSPEEMCADDIQLGPDNSSQSIECTQPQCPFLTLLRKHKLGCFVKAVLRFVNFMNRTDCILFYSLSTETKL
ncbi:unnamed protein product [Trichobilharzia szidati]|nr:unnamed protein product [Trichobilharzia szidati]